MVLVTWILGCSGCPTGFIGALGFSGWKRRGVSLPSGNVPPPGFSLCQDRAQVHPPWDLSGLLSPYDVRQNHFFLRSCFQVVALASGRGSWDSDSACLLLGPLICAGAHRCSLCGRCTSRPSWPPCRMLTEPGPVPVLLSGVLAPAFYPCAPSPSVGRGVGGEGRREFSVTAKLEAVCLM